MLTQPIFRHFALIFLLATPLFGAAQQPDIRIANGGTVSEADLTESIELRMRQLHVAGFAIGVVNDGKLVYRRNFGHTGGAMGRMVEDNSIFEGASMTKPVFAYLIMKQVDKELLDLDKPLFEYKPYPRLEHEERYKAITARMVLTHTTGLPNWAYGRQLELQFDPGTGFNYSGEGYVFLGKVLEELTKMPLSELVQQEVFRPLGMSSTSWVWEKEHLERKATGHYNGNVPSTDHYRPQQANPAASIHTTVADFLLFMEAIWERKGLKEASFEEMFKVQANFERGLANDFGSGSVAWGLGWVLEKTEQGVKWHHGGNNGDFESYFELWPGQKSGYVYFSNSDMGDEMNAVLRQLLNKGKVEWPDDGEVPIEHAIGWGEQDWKVEGDHEMLDFKGKQGMYFRDGGSVELKGKKYKNFVAEFDVALDAGFCSAGIRFRMKDGENYENVYLRGHESGGERALQYTPVFNGLSGWQLYHGSNYNRSVYLRKQDWTHVRVAVFDDWMEVFVDNMGRLAMHVFDLKHSPEAGQITLWSDAACHFANFRIHEVPKYDFYYDRQPKPQPETGTIVNWQVSEAFPADDFQPDKPAPLKWTPRTCEYNGLVNLARTATLTDANNTTIAKFTVTSDKAQRKRLQFGYSDIARIYLNGKILYEGQRIFGSRDEGYVGTIGFFENVYLDLKEGENEVWFVVTEEFGGWGAMAKFADLAGLRF